METLNSNISTVINPDISINDLCVLQAQGFSVVRSAHIGNLQPYNMSLAAAGIPVLCIDHTVTGIDVNYSPEMINSAGKSERIAELGKLVSRVELARIPRIDGVDTTNVRYLDDLHLASARAALPGAEIFSNTAYLRANETLVGDIIASSIKVEPGLFRRVAQPDGNVQKTTDAIDLAQAGKILQLQADPRAATTTALIPNEVDIVIDFVVEALKTGRDKQYHLSGPDMVQYINGKKNILDKLYAQVTNLPSLRSQLPGTLQVDLVPTTAARFATTGKRRASLDDLLQAVEDREQDLKTTNNERGEFFRTPAAKDRSSREQAVAAFRQHEHAADAALARASNSVPELFIPPRTPGYLTQYDVLADGGLYVPEANQRLTFAELKSLFQDIEKVRSDTP